MIITEEEAKNKRCQEGFGQPIYNSQTTTSDLNLVAISSQSYGSGMAVFGAPSHCIGSGCMAWMWVVADRSDTYGRESADKGFCGKAGRP